MATRRARALHPMVQRTCEGLVIQPRGRLPIADGGAADGRDGAGPGLSSGSCIKGDWLYFHWKAILIPTRIAQFGVVQEVAHLREPYHTPAFCLRVERAIHDFAQRKTWLAEHGIDVEGI